MIDTQNTQMLPRTDTFLACCMLMLTVGAMYSFSAFSGRLGESMNFDATELNLIGTAYNLGTWFGVIGGMICDRYGPIQTIRYGALICNLGTIGSALAYVGVLPQSSVMFAILAFVFSQGTGWAYLSGMKQGLQKFHKVDHPTIVGTLACFVALSAGVVSQLYKCALALLPLPVFYVTLGLSCAALQLGATKFFGDVTLDPKELDPHEAKCIRQVTHIATGLMGWLLLMAMVEVNTDVTQAGMMMLWVGMMCFVLAIPLLSWWWRTSAGPAPEVAPDDVFSEAAPDTKEGSSELDSTVDEGNAGGTGDSISMMVPEPPADRSFSNVLIAHMKTVNFWLLVTSITAALAFPITLLNNITPLAQSMRGADSSSKDEDEINETLERIVGACVALFSVGNSGGRLLSGILVHRFTMVVQQPRWVWFLLACSSNLLGSAILFVSWSTSSLYYVTALAGFGLGVTFTVSPITTSDVFGEANFATMWGALTISPCISTELLGTVLAGHVADSARQTSSVLVNGHSYCLGTSCFKTTFIVTTCIEIMALCAWFVLLRRMR